MPSHTVLIIDDSRMSRMLVGAIVGEAYPDAKIIEAGNGKEALIKSASANVDFVTIDLNMPGMDGFEIASELRKRFPEAKMGLLTATIQESIQQKAAALGIEFIPKPITQDNIQVFLEESS
ncbi:MAG: response regulator [Gammaproteobacteria bacterium]|nr:response regulator [Gammaproteobacteria bacterium]